jgi:hypothetical protein
MATFIAITACNGPELRDPDEVQKLIERYSWDGEVVPFVRKDEGDGRAHLALHGYDWPGAWRIPDGTNAEEFEPDYDLHPADGFEEFLKEVTPLLAEPLTVQAIGSEHCRFPISACEWHVRPGDSAVEITGFKYSISEDANADGEAGGDSPQPSADVPLIAEATASP